MKTEYKIRKNGVKSLQADPIILMMIKQFGEEYKKYMKKTGRMFPKFR